MDNWILKYYQHIKDGTITTGQWIRMLYEKIIADLENRTVFFDQKKANRAINFMESFLHHSKGHLAPKLIRLEEWQKAMISCIFGLVDKNGIRRYKEVLCVVGRKCGKSLLASGIAEYMAYADGEYGADVYFLAPRMEQTEIVFNGFWQSVSMEPSLASITKKRKTDIYIERANTSIRKIAFSQKKSDGFNPHLTVCDEIAAWQGDAGIKQYEVMTSALGSRRQPLVLSITTANYVNDGIYDNLMARATRVLRGESRETSLLPFLYIIDDPDKWNDLPELQKSLPNLGVSVSYSFMLEEIAKAEGSLTNKREFLCKYCNIKQNSSQAWLDARAIEECFGEELKIEDFKNSYAVGGIDLSQTTDLTAAILVIEKKGILNVFAKFFLPEKKLEEAIARDGLPYEIYIQKGWLQLSGENFVDYHDCQEWFVHLLTTEKIYPLKIGYDRYSSQYLVQEMKDFYSFHMDDVFQGFNLTPVIRETEGLVKDKKFNFGNNELLKIHLLNSALKIDTEQNKVRLVKIAANEHIDGTAALLDAMCVRQKWWTEIGGQLEN
jgi:phage terminase large subunit-like protein